MNNPKWQFEQPARAQRQNEQTQEEFFSNADVVSEVSGLVREAIQNSLDEVLDPSKPTRMVFTVGRQLPAVTRRYFEDLYPHIEKSGIPDLPNYEESSKYLVIEDFNTRGLEGPTTSFAPPEEIDGSSKPKTNYSFWFFEWSSGKSNKPAGSRGSWGVGKIVFPRASGIKSYLVLSTRRPESAPDNDPSILFGHCILKYRTLAGIRYVPDCQWMINDSEGLPIPSPGPGAHEAFTSDWKLSRAVNELGTSIVIPFCRETMTAEKLVQSIIRDYFVSILSGLLECEVRDEYGTVTSISRDSLVELIEEIVEENGPRGAKTKEELKALCQMYLSHLNNETVEITIPLNDDTPNDWNIIELTETEAERVSDAYGNGKIIELKIETKVPKFRDPAKESCVDSFVVLVQKAQEMRSSTVYCREGILIPAANPSSQFLNCVSMVIVGDMTSSGELDNSLATLLKNAEGPSHETWSPNASKFKGRYTPVELAERTVRWVKQSVDKCLKLIQGQDEEEDDTSLSTFFPIEKDDDGSDPGVIRVVLRGQRDQSDATKGLLSWRAEGFSPTSYVLKQLAPVAVELDEGTSESSTTTVAIPSLETTYRFQMTMSDGVREILSNVVVFAPDREPPLPRAQVEVRKTKNGFAIVPRDGKPIPSGYKFMVTVSYRSGRSKRMNWDQEDFLLSDLFINSESKGLQVLEARDNWGRFTVTDQDFYGEWLGFDILRDLIIDIQEA
jgi:hypothetical protein